MPGRDAQLRPETLSASASSNEVAPVKVAGKSAVVSAGDDEGRISTRGFAVGALAHKEAVLAELGRCLVADVKVGDTYTCHIILSPESYAAHEKPLEEVLPPLRTPLVILRSWFRCRALS